jgi:hypothetical protein
MIATSKKQEDYSDNDALNNGGDEKKMTFNLKNDINYFILN